MRPKFKWRGATDSEAGKATYEIGANLETLDLPAFRDAHVIHDLLRQAYDAGREDALRLARQRLNALMGQLE